MGIEPYYPRNGFSHWFWNKSPTPIGEHRFCSAESALAFGERQNDEVSIFGISCEVIHEYSSEHPAYPWRVLCAGKAAAPDRAKEGR